MVNPGLKFGPYEETSNWRFFLSSAEASLPHKIFAMIFLKKKIELWNFQKINIYNSHSRCYLAECVTNSSHSKKKTSLKPDFLIHDNGEEAKIWGVNTWKNLHTKHQQIQLTFCVNYPLPQIKTCRKIVRNFMYILHK